MSEMRAKKDRQILSTDLSLTPSTELKVGETFVVLRRAPNKDGVSDERCVATIVEIRNDENEDEASDFFEPPRKVMFVIVLFACAHFLFTCMEERGVALYIRII